MRKASLYQQRFWQLSKRFFYDQSTLWLVSKFSFFLRVMQLHLLILA
jgi:hypothetical protein